MIVDPQKYDGHLLHRRFAFRYFADAVSPLGNIIAFRGEMEVLADAMIDQEDVATGAFIWSDDAINFLWELPILGNNAFAAVSYQHLFNSHIAKILSDKEFLNKQVYLKGDDLMVRDAAFPNHEGKCSVSITHLKQGAALGHTGINIVAGDKAPAVAYSTKLNSQQVLDFMNQIIFLFEQLNRSLFIATTKVF